MNQRIFRITKKYSIGTTSIDKGYINEEYITTLDEAKELL